MSGLQPTGNDIQSDLLITRVDDCQKLMKCSMSIERLVFIYRTDNHLQTNKEHHEISLLTEVTTHISAV